MKKKLAIFLSIALAAATVTGCGQGAATIPVETAGTTPGSEASSRPIGQLVQAGGESLESGNCSAIDITTDGTKVTAVLKFASGSEKNGTAQSEADHVPQYKVLKTGSPSRVVVEFDTLSYWDYDRLLDYSQGDDLFYSVFKQFQNDDERFRIFFQLKEDVDVTVEEDGGSLTLTFVPKANAATEQWYVVADDYYSFCDGSVGSDTGLAPTLADDLSTALLISMPYATKEEAEAASSDILTKLHGGIDSSCISIQQLMDNQLPSVAVETEDSAIYNTSVVSIDGEASVLPVVVSNGIYLCSSPDGTKQVFSCISRSRDDAGNVTGITEQLWSLDQNGKLKKLIDSEFEAIELAKFSPDGRKLAILELASGISYVYILDLDTGALTNISEEGLGKITNYFIWDLLGSELYLMSGNNSVKLMKYDFTIADLTQRVTEVEENEVDGADMAFFNGDLYYTDTDKDNNMIIYKIKPEGGLRAEFAKGDSFAISPNGKYMSIVQSAAMGDSTQETQKNTSVMLLDMETGEKSYVIQDSYVIKVAWSEDGKAVYYTLGSDSEEEQEFGFGLYRFDVETGETIKCADLASSNFNVTPEPRVLYIPYYYADDDTSLRATYRLNVGE